MLISQALSHIEGAYNTGLYHARQAIQIEPKNITYKEYILLFNNIPEKLINDLEAIAIAKEILKQDPTNATALQALTGVNKKGPYFV